MREYETLEAAGNAVDATMGDIVGDNPEIDGDDAWYSAVVAIAGMSREDVARELCRTRLGYVPEEVGL